MLSPESSWMDAYQDYQIYIHQYLAFRMVGFLSIYSNWLKNPPKLGSFNVDRNVIGFVITFYVFSLSKYTYINYSPLSSISNSLISVSTRLIPTITGTGESTIVNRFSGTLYMMGFVHYNGASRWWKKWTTAVNTLIFSLKNTMEISWVIARNIRISSRDVNTYKAIVVLHSLTNDNITIPQVILH